MITPRELADRLEGEYVRYNDIEDLLTEVAARAALAQEKQGEGG